MLYNVTVPLSYWLGVPFNDRCRLCCRTLRCHYHTGLGSLLVTAVGCVVERYNAIIILGLGSLLMTAVGCVVERCGAVIVLAFKPQSLKVLSLKPGVGQYLAKHATLTARDFFLANFLYFFSKTSPEFFLLTVANIGSFVGLQNKIGHPAGCRFSC